MLIRNRQGLAGNDVVEVLGADRLLIDLADLCGIGQLASPHGFVPKEPERVIRVGPKGLHQRNILGEACDVRDEHLVERAFPEARLILEVVIRALEMDLAAFAAAIGTHAAAARPAGLELVGAPCRDRGPRLIQKSGELAGQHACSVGIHVRVAIQPRQNVGDPHLAPGGRHLRL